MALSFSLSPNTYSALLRCTAASHLPACCSTTSPLPLSLPPAPPCLFPSHPPCLLSLHLSSLPHPLFLESPRPTSPHALLPFLPPSPARPLFPLSPSSLLLPPTPPLYLLGPVPRHEQILQQVVGHNRAHLGLARPTDFASSATSAAPRCCPCHPECRTQEARPSREEDEAGCPPRSLGAAEHVSALRGASVGASCSFAPSLGTCITPGCSTVPFTVNCAPAKGFELG